MAVKGAPQRLTAPQMQALQSDLESIDRAATIVPMRNSELFFDLRTHIDRARTNIVTRLAEGPSKGRHQ
jgi:hypothetical protein